MVSIAIIGAGIAGLTLAHKLKNVANVTIFEKKKVAGGRMRSKQCGGYTFDHGTQFFTVRTALFADFLRPLQENGVVEVWRGRFVEFSGNEICSQRVWENDPSHFVGCPDMQAIGSYLAKGLNLSLENRVEKLRAGGQWNLINKDNQSIGHYDWVISTAPQVQTTAIMPKSFQQLATADESQMTSCYSLMLGFKKPLPLNFDAALVKNMDISWISVNSSKPGRNAGYMLLVHSTNKWSDGHNQDDDESVIQHLCSQLQQVIGLDVTGADCTLLKHWPYANMKKRKANKYYLDRTLQLAACGDWCIQGRVEAAFLSAHYLADDLLRSDMIGS